MWGTRGSSPCSLSHDDVKGLILELAAFAKSSGVKTLDGFCKAIELDQLGGPLSLGGHTMCTEIMAKKTSIYVDFGSGLRLAGTRDIAEGRKEFVFFLTHMHWDHLIGLNFFVPLLIPGHKITIYHGHGNAPVFIKKLFGPPYFPVAWEKNPKYPAIGAEVEFRHMKLYRPIKIGDITVTMFNLDHPGGCFGYRFEADGKAVVVGVDGEYQRATQEELGRDLPYYQNLDLLIFDAQYSMEELINRLDWGHCSPVLGIDLALREGIKNLLFLHHDPWASRIKLLRSMAASQDYLKKQMEQLSKRGQLAEHWQGAYADGPKLHLGYDGIELDLKKAQVKKKNNAA